MNHDNPESKLAEHMSGLVNLYSNGSVTLPMASFRTEEIRDALDRLYAHLDDVQQDTRQKLVSDALHIVDFHANNWIDILSWIRSKYTREEQMNIFMLHFLRLFKEIYWLELFLLNANYPMIHRNLRYIWEMICQAYYVDTHHAGLTLDEQVEEAKECVGPLVRAS